MTDETNIHTAATSEMEADDRIRLAIESIRFSCEDVSYVATALSELGIPAAAKLHAAVENTIEAVRTIRSSQRDLVYLRVAASEQSTMNMMNAVLAVLPK